MPRPPFPITASPKTSLWQPTPYPPSQLFSSILLSNSVHTTYIPVLDMHISLPHHTWQFPYPQPGCHRATIPPLPNKKLHFSLGQSLTMSYSQPLQTQPVSTTLVPTTLVLNSAPSSCSTWVLWNSTNNCTNLGIFILFGTYAYSCLPLDPPGP